MSGEGRGPRSCGGQVRGGWGALLLAVGLLAFAGWAQVPQGVVPAVITRWLDGDTATITFRGTPPEGVATRETVRLLGVNAPEVGEHLSEEATRFFRDLTQGRVVSVGFNPGKLRDTHRRLLVYVWVETEQGWQMVNEAVLRAGMARLLLYEHEPEPYGCTFRRAQTLAQVEKLGLWGAFSEVLSLFQVEARPVLYVTQAVSVNFRVGSVTVDRSGWSLWAEGSRFGFRALVRGSMCPEAWSEHGWDFFDWVGQEVVVSGELLWDSLGGGPRIEVLFPEQLKLSGGSG